MIYIRVSKITGVPIKENASMKAIQINFVGQDTSQDYSICQILPDQSDNKYQSIITTEKIWNFPIDINLSPCSIAVRLLDMEPEQMEIQRAILSTKWFNINTYVSEFFPMKPMVPCLGPAVALIDVHYVDPKKLPPNQIFKPFEVPKGSMLIQPRWRNLKPFVPSNQQAQNDNNNFDDFTFTPQLLPQDTNLRPLIPEEDESNSQQKSRFFGILNLSKKNHSKNESDTFEFPSFPKEQKKIDPFYVAFEKYSFDENTLQQKFEEFEKAKKVASSEKRRGSQNQIESPNKRRGSQNQEEGQIKRRGSSNQIDSNQRKGSQGQIDTKTKGGESHNQAYRPIPPIHNKKSDH